MGNVKQPSFDSLLEKVLAQTPLIGKQMWKLYEGNPVFARFVKYGGWIALQFWALRAPLVWFLVGLFPKDINLLIHTVPSYLVADFIVGLTLAVLGFLVSEGWIWKMKPQGSA